MRDQHFIQDLGQGDYNNNAASGQCFKHYQGHSQGSQQIAELFSQPFTFLLDCGYQPWS